MYLKLQQWIYLNTGNTEEETGCQPHFRILWFILSVQLCVCVCVRLCLLILRARGSVLGFNQDAVCVVADMMCNRCEAVRRGDVRSCPCRRRSCPPHLLPPTSHQAPKSLAQVCECVCVCEYVYLCMCVHSSH